MGAKEFPNDANRAKWISTAETAAQIWLNAKPISGQAPEGFPPFGHILEKNGMTFFLGSDRNSHVALYSNGHWLQALCALHDVQPKKIYRDRATALVAYYFGNNDAQINLLNELGAVYNRISDDDQDGVFDKIQWDAYPESTAFFQIGLLHYIGLVQEDAGNFK